MFYFVGGAKLCPLHVPKSYSSQTKLLENPYALDKSFIFATVMATPSIGKKTDTSRCYDQSAKGAALPYDRNDLSCRLPMNSIAALIREGAEEVSKRQGSKRASTMVQRMINSLQWRQAHSKDEFYPLTFETGTRLRLRQLQAGEVTGLGTGATVWPAAHVLVKYLERRYGEGGMEGLRVLDLGSGTGIAGIAAAALGAAESFLTDQEQLLFLMQENADRNLSECKIPASVMRVFTYNWGMQDDRISSPVDVILISDCVLPKLYPIEPLVNAIHMLSGPETVTIMSYEHRHYPEFDPRRRFEELAAARGLSKTNIPQRDHHPIFSADDIEIWEVSRARRVLDFLRVENEGDGLTAEVKGEIGTSEDYAPVSQGRVDVVTISQSPSDSAVTMATLFGERHELSQALSGAIGCYLWPSGVVMARHLLAATLGATSKGLDGNEDGGTCESARSYPPRARMLELGSGVGLVAMAAALIGWDVLATDRADTVPLLKANIDRFLTSTKRESTPWG